MSLIPTSLRRLATEAISLAGKEASALEELHSESRATVRRMAERDPGLRERIDQAYAYAVFPSVGKATAVVGGAFGKGEVFRSGRLIGYAGVVQLTLGLQLGGQTFSEIVTFDDRRALDRFKSGRTTFAASASAVLVKAGAAASARPDRGTTAFVSSDGGLMLEAAIGGQKFFFKPAALGRMKSAPRLPKRSSAVSKTSGTGQGERKRRHVRNDLARVSPTRASARGVREAAGDVPSRVRIADCRHEENGPQRGRYAHSSELVLDDQGPAAPPVVLSVPLRTVRKGESPAAVRAFHPAGHVGFHAKWRFVVRRQGRVVDCAPLADRACRPVLDVMSVTILLVPLRSTCSAIRHKSPPPHGRYCCRATPFRHAARPRTGPPGGAIMSAESHEPARYWAFISYSHRDRRWGDWLHRSLETYRVPRRLVGKPSRDGVVPGRVFPIFRDREELPVSADLGQNINQALRESRYLIVICSPRSAASRWVNEEVLYFKRLGRADRILALIVEGEPNASDGKPGVPPGDECFPEAMRFHLGEGGGLSAYCAEPIAADARDGKDGRDNARLKLLAGLLGVNYDALKRRDERRRRARRLLAAGIGLVIAVLLAGQWGWQERAKSQMLARQLGSAYRERAERFVEKADDVDAALYFAQSNALSPSRAARDAALLRLQELVLPRAIFEHGGAIEAVAFAPDGRTLLTAGDGGRVRIWDAGSGALVTQFRMDVETYMFKRASFTRDGRRIFTAAENARLWDARSGKPLTPAIPFKAVTSTGRDLSGSTVSESIYVDCAALDPDERRIVLHWNEENLVQFWDAETARPAGDRRRTRTG